MSDKLTFEQAIAGVLSPWFDKDVDLGAGTRIATAKDAAAHAFVAAMNTDDSQRGTVRVLVTSAEEKREIHGYLTAFFADAPQLKQMRLLRRQRRMHSSSLAASTSRSTPIVRDWRRMSSPRSFSILGPRTPSPPFGLRSTATTSSPSRRRAFATASTRL